MTATYTAKDISVLEGLEPVRKRPGMYIGGVGNTGLHHLAWEIVDNSIDEAMNGFASEIGVTLHTDGCSLSVSDNGRGIPIDKFGRTRKSALEVIMTTLHAGGKFDPLKGGYRTSGGLHGVGASVVNALSSQMTVTVKRGGAAWEMRFRRGKVQGTLKKTADARGSGTTTFFRPDPTIFPKTEFDAETIRQHLEIASYVHKGLKVVFDDQVNKKKETFLHEQGIVEYVSAMLDRRGDIAVHEQPFTMAKTNGNADQARIELVLQWTESTDEHLRSYVNGIPTIAGGTHENGLRAGLNKAMRNYIETHKLVPKGVAIATDDIREGLVGVLSMFLTEPQFQGQTKERLNNPELYAQIDSAVRPVLEHWLNHNRTAAESIVARIILSARARQASRAASAAVTRKSATSGRVNLPGKLSDCSSTNSGLTELFIVEGDSAGGSAKQGRDRVHQAILPLRGKVLNSEQATTAKVLANKELADIVTALGCGVGKHVKVDKLRYGKVILLMDADSDGHHIATLLLTFFYRYLRPLIQAGRIYLAQPPLYRINIAKDTYWAADDHHRDALLKQHTKGNAKVDITRFKGLGEMMPKVLWSTTLNPKTRRLLAVDIGDPLATERVISELMGKDAAPRFDFIMKRAEEAMVLDV
jgi:DNA gyrase subunit B